MVEPIIRLVVLWTVPEDAVGMDSYYESSHLNLVRRLPGLQGVDVSLLRSREYSRMAELYFSDVAALKKAMSSDAGVAVADDTKRIEASFNVSQRSFIAVTPVGNSGPMNTAKDQAGRALPIPPVEIVKP